MALEIRPLGPALGAEVRGLDLAREVTAADRQVLAEAYAEHHLLRLHHPGLSSEDHLRFAALFGPLWDERGAGEFVQYVSNTRDDRIIDEGPLLFHSDLAFTPKPVLGLSLYAVTVPKGGAPTRFANAARAWRCLPEALRSRLTGARARHLFDLETQRGDVPYREETLPERAPRATHPVCFPHPVSGREILYLSEMQSDRILDVSPEESTAALADAFAVLYAEDNVYEHAWRPGDLLVWDNLALQHARPAMPDAQERTLRRVTLATAGVADQVASFGYG